MGNKKTLDLEPIITGLCYRKTETLTETEIRQAITTAMLNFGVEYVTTLPTGDNIKQKVYILPDTSGTAGNFGDIYVYDRTNSKWIHMDALKFNIDDYTKIADIKNNLISTDTNKPLSANQGKILKGLVDNKVDKITGKGLSTEDYTTAEKTKLSGIEAEANKITRTSQLTNDGDGTNVFVKNNDSRLTDSRTPNSHLHGSIANDGKLNSDISSVNKIVVTDSSNNVKTISQLPSNKVTHQDISGKVDKNNGANTMTDSSAYSNLGTTAGATQKTINTAINNKLTTIMTVTLDYDNGTTGTYNIYGSEVIT